MIAGARAAGRQSWGVVPSVLISVLLILALVLAMALIVAGMLRTAIVRHRRARDKAHILQRVADLEEHRE